MVLAGAVDEVNAAGVHEYRGQVTRNAGEHGVGGLGVVFLQFTVQERVDTTGLGGIRCVNLAACLDA